MQKINIHETIHTIQNLRPSLPRSSNIVAGILMTAFVATSLSTAAAIISAPDPTETGASPSKMFIRKELAPSLAEMRAERIAWATAHNAVDPAGLVDAAIAAATKDSQKLSGAMITVPSSSPFSYLGNRGVTSLVDFSMADLLIGIGLQESLGDKDAVGLAGELGAFQVIPSDWGPVPKDLPGQARQARDIITELLTVAKGRKYKALAHYNGGDFPPAQSYDYAAQVLAKTYHTKK